MTARLVDAEGGAVVPEGDAEAELVVLSPVLSFQPTKEVGSMGRGGCMLCSGGNVWLQQPRIEGLR